MDTDNTNKLYTIRAKSWRVYFKVFEKCGFLHILVVLNCGKYRIVWG